MAQSYDCSQCPGYCCSYPVIPVTKRDVQRLAKALDMTEARVESRFTRSAHGHKRILKRKPDSIFGRICRFFDIEARQCTVYAARPAICRSFPRRARCGYYDFLSFERETQGDPDHIALTNSGDWT